MDTIVQVAGLQKALGASVAMDEVSCKIREGKIFGMVGSNGAGKIIFLTSMEVGKHL
jgi:ABC-2 type transport system ATP-binding protein